MAVRLNVGWLWATLTDDPAGRPYLGNQFRTVECKIVSGGSLAKSLVETLSDNPATHSSHANLDSRLQCLVGAIAIRRSVRVLALTEPGVAAFFCGKLLGREPCAFVCAVAERLRGRTPAGAKPVIFSRLKHHLGRSPSRNNRFCTHGANPIPHRRDSQDTRYPPVFCPPNCSRPNGCHQL